jgi:hypothetical protein
LAEIQKDMVTDWHPQVSRDDGLSLDDIDLTEAYKALLKTGPVCFICLRVLPRTSKWIQS